MKLTNVRPTAAPASLPFSIQPPLRQRLLVADDHEDIRLMNVDALCEAGFEVDSAAHGEAAWDALQTYSYDLLITDNAMPRLTGLELLKKLRAARMVVPVVMASGTLPLDEFARAPWLQPAALLVKPYLLNALVQTVKIVLRLRVSSGAHPEPPPTVPGERPPLLPGGSPYQPLSIGPWPFLPTIPGGRK